MKAMFAYQATSENELDMNPGDMITVLQVSPAVDVVTPPARRQRLVAGSNRDSRWLVPLQLC